MLQKGASRELKDSKNRDPITLATEKNKTKILEMLNEKNGYQLCTIRQPLEKIEKSRLNIFIFIALHIFVETIAFFINLPRKNFQ